MEQTPTTGRLRVLSSLRHRNYRLLWTGTLVSHTGDWLDQIALNWLVLEQTGSVFYLGVVNLCRGVPIMLFTLVGGALADRMDRRRLMMISQSGAMVLATLLAVLAFRGPAPIWAIFAIATMRGVVVSVNLPARQSLIPQLVPRPDLPNALALNTTTINLTKVIGPLLSGIIIAFFGTAVCFAINAVSFIGVLVALSAMRFPKVPPPLRRESIAGSIASGLRFVRGDSVILLLVLVALVPTFFAQPYMNLLAVFAHDVLETGPIGLGQLTAAAGFGSVVGAVLVAQFSDRLRSGTVMLSLLVGFGVVLAVFAINRSPALAPLILVFAGLLYMTYNVTHAMLLQLTVPDEYRGRVLSILFLNRGLVSLGTASSATIASLLGPRAAFLIMAGVVVAFGLALLAFSPALRRLRP